MYLLRLNNYKNLRIILTNKYLIIITKNGIIKFQTNFYNLYITNNNLYFDFSNKQEKIWLRGRTSPTKRFF